MKKLITIPLLLAIFLGGHYKQSRRKEAPLLMSQPITLQSALTPTVLKAVLSNSLLKEIMTDSLVMRSGESTDFDTVLSPGHYCPNMEYWTNHPPKSYKYGVLLVFGNRNSFLSQIYLPHQPSGQGQYHMYSRIRYKPYNSDTAVWAPWDGYSGTVLT